MFSYYGSKSKIIKHYPSPTTLKIREPFAGSARYSEMYWETPDIILVEKFEKVFLVWKYLQEASEKDILSLPNIGKGDSLLNHKELSLPEKYLIGYHLRRGTARPNNTIGDRCSWDKDKIRIASNLYKIKHWKIIFGDYRELENENATWFIDPPYFHQVHKYSCQIDSYTELANWCKSRLGQVIVCENEHGKWLDFKPLIKLNGTCKQTTEHIWTNEKSDTKDNLLFQRVGRDEIRLEQPSMFA